jgi:hypothetical protein
VNLPALSRLLVTKIAEVMACGRMLITPSIDHPTGTRNMAQFEDGRHLVYYDSARPRDLADIVNHYLQHPEERDAIASAGRLEVRRGHTLEARLRAMIADVEFGKAASSPFFSTSTSNSDSVLAQKRYRLQTAWNSFVYYDRDAKVIGHAQSEAAPNNLCLSVSNLRASLISFSPQTQDAVQLCYDQPAEEWLAPGTTRGGVRPQKEHVPDCDLEFVGADQVIIRHRNNYLSADPDGIVRNDRSWGLQHETFRLVGLHSPA